MPCKFDLILYLFWLDSEEVAVVDGDTLEAPVTSHTEYGDVINDNRASNIQQQIRWDSNYHEAAIFLQVCRQS